MNSLSIVFEIPGKNRWIGGLEHSFFQAQFVNDQIGIGIKEAFFLLIASAMMRIASFGDFDLRQQFG